jgi:hypothetical protein
MGKICNRRLFPKRNPRTYMKNLNNSLFIPLVLLSAFFTAEANAQVLITINDSDPSAVTFTATGNLPSTANSDHLYSDGLDFANFFTIAGLFPSITATSTSLVTGVDGTPDYTALQSSTFSGSDVDLQLTAASGNDQNFSTSTPAFVGTATFDFSASSFFNAASLPAAGTTGDLYAGSGSLFRAAPVLIGSYEVVAPEPSTNALLLVGTKGLLALGLRGRLRNASAEAI